MEVLLLIIILLSLVTNVLVMRFFFKRLSDKILFILKDSEETAIPSTNSSMPRFSLPMMARQTPIDSPLATKNEIENDENEIEFNEQNFSNLPKDVRFEIEGGDAQIPPGFSEVKTYGR